jgi:cyclophilin family peptidyl-prolyl cis-trans isomerase
MASWATVGARAAARFGAAGVVLGAVLAWGCGGGNGPDKAAEKPAPPRPEPSARETLAPPKVKPRPARPLDRWLHQSFAEATVPDPADGQILPDKTMTGKSVGKLYTEVTGLWDKIKFQKEDGTRLGYEAVLETQLGAIAITLRPDIAPNHVRSFLALAKAGYYDGLVFERSVHMVADDNPDLKLDYLQAGCPLGTGAEGFGSIGYWLKPEFNPKVHHEEGTVGTWHEREADTAACRFYITLGKAPVMDGNFTVFGRVTQGMDVVRNIAQQPVRTDDEFKDRPVNPVVIQKVTIHTREVDQKLGE